MTATGGVMEGPVYATDSGRFDVVCPIPCGIVLETVLAALDAERVLVGTSVKDAMSATGSW